MSKMMFSSVKKVRSSTWGCFFFQAEDGIRDVAVTGVQTCALPIRRASAFSLADASGGAAAVDAPGPARVISHRLIFRCGRNRDCTTTRKNNLLYGTLKL